MSPDPGSDRPLDCDLVRRLLREQFPRFASAAIAYVGEGYDHQMYRVAGDWMFRFPKRTDVVPWFLREVASMRVIGKAIGVPVPRFEHVGRRASDFPYPFAAYRRLPGIGSDEAELIDVPQVAETLGGGLTRLHSIDPALIPDGPQQDPEPQVWRFMYDETIADGIARHLRDEVFAFLEGEIPRPAFAGPLRVAHSDLLPEHVLIDPATGRLTGIIDFADLDIGDPARDFVGLLEIGGPELIEKTLEHYTVALDDTFMERLNWRLRAFYLHELTKANDSDLREQQELVELAFTL